MGLLAFAPTAAVAAPAPAAADRGPWKVTATDGDGSHPDADKGASKAAHEDAKAARKEDREDAKADRKAERQGDPAPPGRDGDVPRPLPPTEPGPSPEPSPAPDPGPDRGPAPEPAPAAPGPPPPSARQPSPPPPAPAPSGEAEAPVSAQPVRGTGGTTPPTEAAATAAQRSTTGVLRGAIDVATGTTGDVGSEVAASLGAAASAAGELLASGLTAAARTTPEMPVPARDLGVPIGVLALIGAYLAASRWLDRGGLPMTLTEGREDDVQLVL